MAVLKVWLSIFTSPRILGPENEAVFRITVEPLRFTLEAVGFQYFDQEKDKFVMIKTSELDMGEDHFTARFEDYELGFQMIVFKGDTKPTMTMSKYDYKNKKFLEHYTCDAKMAYIE